MKYVVSWIAGAIVGAALFLALLYYNPFTEGKKISPLAVSERPMLDLTFSTVPSESLAYTNNGNSRIKRRPDGIADLWEPAIRHTTW
ncbi:MAG: hypothetical protein WD448_10265 [Woeseia sp.]